MDERLVPLVCLVPSDVALVEGSAAQAIGEETGASVLVAGLDDTPFLSDRILRVLGTAPQLETACLEVLRQLRSAQGVDEGDSAPFVLLVPSTAAGAVVGAKGSRVQALIKSSGAGINVSREVLPRLRAQPVTVTGGLAQAAAAVIGVHAVVQELVAGGRLHVADMGALLKGHAVDAASQGDEDPFFQDGSVAASDASAQPVCLIVSMELAGWIIGKQGRRVAELQRSSGARINVLNDAAAPGLRVGDRLLEVGGADQERMDCGIRTVFAAIAEASTGDEAQRTALLVPEGAVGFVIGRAGQTLKEMMTRTGAEIDIDQSGRNNSGSCIASLVGSCEARAEAAVAVAAKIAELRARPPTDAAVAAKIAEAPPSPAPRSRAAHDRTALSSVSSTGSDFTAGLRRAPAASVAAPAGAVQLALPERPAAVAPSGGGAPGRCVLGIPGAVPLKEMWSPASEVPDVPREPTADERWMVEFLKQQATPAERALLTSLQASGALEQRLTIRVPEAVLGRLDDVSFRSGARFELCSGAAEEDPGHHFITAVGSRTATSIAALHLQECMASVTAS